MKKVAIVYWSGTGNTAAMAQHVKKGVLEAGGAPSIIEADAFSSARLDEFGAVVFGCPAMGDEELEPDEFEPMFAECEKHLAGRAVGLFGSYEWNEGEWMETWQARTEADGANVVGAVIAYDYPDGRAEEECIQLGKDAVAAAAEDV